MYFEGTDLQGVSGKVPGPRGKLWAPQGNVGFAREGNMQSHCKSKKQTDVAKSMWVGVTVSYHQEWLWASQWELYAKGPSLFGGARKRKGLLEGLQWQAWGGRRAQDF